MYSSSAVHEIGHLIISQIPMYGEDYLPSPTLITIDKVKYGTPKIVNCRYFEYENDGNLRVSTNLSSVTKGDQVYIRLRKELAIFLAGRAAEFCFNRVTKPDFIADSASDFFKACKISRILSQIDDTSFEYMTLGEQDELKKEKLEKTWNEVVICLCLRKSSLKKLSKCLLNKETIIGEDLQKMIDKIK